MVCYNIEIEKNGISYNMSTYQMRSFNKKACIFNL